MNRRRFIRSPELAHAAAGMLAPPADPLPPGEFPLVRVSRPAMATQFEVAIPLGSHPDPVAAAEDALDLIDDIEDRLTVYRDHSEASRLNAHAATEPVHVSDDLFRFLQTCATFTRETDGAFDAAAGALIKAWGFYRRQGRVPTNAERAAAMAATGTRHVILDERSTAVRFRVPGLEFNFGAVGKGYALDRAADLLRQRWGVGSALLHGGGSSVLGVGCPPGDPRGWAVRLRHPRDESSLGTVYLRDRAVGTSAATFQHFVYNGRTYGHLLDPRTGRPAEGTASASVTAPTAAEADAMSTALFVLGPAAADRLTRARPHLGAVVLPDATPAPGVGPACHNLAPETYTPPAGGPRAAAHADRPR